LLPEDAESDFRREFFSKPKSSAWDSLLRQNCPAKPLPLNHLGYEFSAIFNQQQKHLKGFARERDRFAVRQAKKQFSRRINLKIFKKVNFFNRRIGHILENFRNFEPFFEDILTVFVAISKLPEESLS